VIADRHLKGLERGWLHAFVRPFTTKNTGSRRSNAGAAPMTHPAAPPRLPGPAAAAQQEDEWVALDGAGNEDGHAVDVEVQILAALKELKASQAAL